jgi:hypothetical protein
MTEFYVLLTAHLGIILVNNQLDAQFFFLICLFQFSTCFEQPHAHHQGNQLYQCNVWYMSLYVGDRLVCRSFISILYMFRAPRAHHQENQLYQYNIWYTSLRVRDRLVCRSFISISYMFRAPRAHHQENQLYQYNV